MVSYTAVDETVLEKLRGVCGAEHVKVDEKTLQAFSHDKVTEEKYAHRPDVAVFPGNTEEVAAVMKLANELRLPVTPRGGGSGLSGGAVPTVGGIVLSLDRMNRIIEIDTDNLFAVVEPGVVTKELDGELKKHNLFFAGYPMSEEICHLAGNVAENAGGGRAVKYGVTGRYVLGLEVVTPEGMTLNLGGKRVKDVTGYDLISLFTGSEGTLGVFTKLYIKLLPRPKHRLALFGFLPTPQTLNKVLPALLADPEVQPSSIEFMDSLCIESVKKTAPKSDVEITPGGAILVEVDGPTLEQLEPELQRAERILTAHGVSGIRKAESEDHLEDVWKVRKQVPWALMRIAPHQSLEDISVPVSTIPAMLDEIRDVSTRYDVPIPCFGHAGDGNLHATPLKPESMSVEDWLEIIPKLLSELYVKAAGLGGTISGEHGIGHKRSPYMKLVLGEAELDIMRRIKRAIDPNHIMNPGKILVDED